MKQKIINYKIVQDGLIILSDSGNEYKITKNSCSCKGFGFKRHCSHFDEALKLGLLEIIENIQNPNQLTSNHIKASRINAIKQFLSKQNIPQSDKLIEFLESKLTTKMTMKEFINLAEWGN